MLKKKINIAPILSSDIVKTISESSPIKSFGSQLKDKNKETLIVGDQTKTFQLDEELNLLTKKEQQAGEEKDKTEKEALYKLNTKQITQEQYNLIVQSSSVALNASKLLIDKNRAKIQKDKDNINNNPYTAILKNQAALNSEIKEVDKNVKKTESKSKKDLTKQVLLNPNKTLASILSLQLSNNLLTLFTKRKQLEELVNQVNLYIDTQVKDESTFIIATNLRNNAISLINSSIKTVDTINKIIKTINAVVIVISIVLKVIERILSLPIPALLPVKVQLQPKLQKILKLLTAVGILLAIINVLLSNEKERLIELRERLKQISLKLDSKAIDELTSEQIESLADGFLPLGVNEFPPYKGFTFKIKEEQDPRFVVKGNKRRYAVAIDRYGVEVIKSDYSFTLDPNDLIEQLKLVIDQQDLQG